MDKIAKRKAQEQIYSVIKAQACLKRVSTEEKGQSRSAPASPRNILVSAPSKGCLEYCTVTEAHTKTQLDLYSDHDTKLQTIILLFSNYCRFIYAQLLFRFMFKNGNDVKLIISK